MRLRRCACAVLWLAVPAFIPARLACQAVDSSGHDMGAVIAQVPFAGQLRIATAGERWTGRLAARTPDSLALSRETSTRSVSLADVATLWALGRQRHSGLLSGAGLGALLFGLLQLGGGSGEDPGLNTKLGLVLLAGTTTLGLLVDATSQPWEQRYPVAGQ
jgi:hypothetical protein